jgi:hypothetical protein
MSTAAMDEIAALHSRMHLLGPMTQFGVDMRGLTPEQAATVRLCMGKYRLHAASSPGCLSLSSLCVSSNRAVLVASASSEVKRSEVLRANFLDYVRVHVLPSSPSAAFLLGDERTSSDHRWWAGYELFHEPFVAEHVSDAMDDEEDDDGLEDVVGCIKALLAQGPSGKPKHPFAMPFRDVGNVNIVRRRCALGYFLALCEEVVDTRRDSVDVRAVAELVHSKPQRAREAGVSTNEAGFVPCAELFLDAIKAECMAVDWPVSLDVKRNVLEASLVQCGGEEPEDSIPKIAVLADALLTLVMAPCDTSALSHLSESINANTACVLSAYCGRPESSMLIDRLRVTCNAVRFCYEPEDRASALHVAWSGTHVCDAAVQGIREAQQLLRSNKVEMKTLQWPLGGTFDVPAYALKAESATLTEHAIRSAISFQRERLTFTVDSVCNSAQAFASSLRRYAEMYAAAARGNPDSPRHMRELVRCKPADGNGVEHSLVTCLQQLSTTLHWADDGRDAQLVAVQENTAEVSTPNAIDHAAKAFEPLILRWAETRASDARVGNLLGHKRILGNLCMQARVAAGLAGLVIAESQRLRRESTIQISLPDLERMVVLSHENTWSAEGRRLASKAMSHISKILAHPDHGSRGAWVAGHEKKKNRFRNTTLVFNSTQGAADAVFLLAVYASHEESVKPPEGAERWEKIINDTITTAASKPGDRRLKKAVTEAPSSIDHAAGA